MVRLLHAADLHLDSPFSALSPEQAARRRQEQRAMLTQLAELANAHECDLMLLAGDLFDSDNAYPDSVDTLRRAFASCRAEIVIAPGNHDFCAPGSAYLTETWSENVHIFTKQALSYFEFPQLSCRVWGAAFTAPDAPALLEGFSARRDGWLELMALHGDALNAGSPYNAVTREQIAASGLCYLFQNVGLVHVSPAQGSLLLSLESVFGVLASVLFYGEVVTGRMAVGFVLIFAAILISELAPARAKSEKRLKAGESPDAPKSRSIPIVDEDDSDLVASS